MATYGIDLGTTYSCIASIDDVGRPTVLKNAVGQDTTPSVVYFEAPDSVVVGQTAKSSAMLYPDLVVSLIKRQMGQEDVEFDFHGQRHTPESISALVLRELARAAGEQTQEEVRDVVVTVPAYFGVAEREATRKAGEIAGLNVLNIVAEPIAAALHYETLSDDTDKTLLVYDLGGGTFDTTVIRLQGDDIRVECTDGDHRLGGADWDDRVVDHLLDAFTAAHPTLDPSGDEYFLQDLAIAAEQLKQDLSSAQKRKHIMRFGGETVSVELTREEFEELTSGLLDRTMDITQRTLDTARDRGITTFDDVLLVGGSTRMPAVARSLKDRFGFDARLHDPDLAVAKGAARFALIESVKVSVSQATDGVDAASDDEAVQEVASRLGLTTETVRQLADKKVTTVVPRAFGVLVLDRDDPRKERRIVRHLLAANTALPARHGPERFVTAFPNQTAIQVEVWEQAGSQASPDPEHNAHIGEGTIDGLPPLPEGSPIDVTYDMDEMGTLRAYAVELSTGKDLHLELTIGGLDEQRLTEARNAIAGYHVNG